MMLRSLEEWLVTCPASVLMNVHRVSALVRGDRWSTHHEPPLSGSFGLSLVRELPWLLDFYIPRSLGRLEIGVGIPRIKKTAQAFSPAY